jgi:acyl-CoA thioester hydrolase
LLIINNFGDEMSRVYTTSFPVRYYECDPYGHVNNANYLRYATEAALQASADARYGWDKYQELGTLWLIREAGVEYLRPAGRGDTLTVKTWVSDFRRVRSRREVEITLADSGELCAKIYLDWVYLDAKTQQPARIPPELMGAFFPEGAPAEAPKREAFPELPPPPSGAHVARRRVRWYQLDPAGHVNSAWYLSLIEDAAIEAAEAGGWSAQRSAENGLAYFAREHRVEFLRPALMGDELTITTYVSPMRRSTATRYYRINLASGEAVARAQTVWVWVDSATGRPTRIPDVFRQDFAGQMVSD